MCVCVCCAKGRVGRLERKITKSTQNKETAVTITSDMRAMSSLLLLLLLLLLSEQERLQVRARVGAVFWKYGCALLLLHALQLCLLQLCLL